MTVLDLGKLIVNLDWVMSVDIGEIDETNGLARVRFNYGNANGMHDIVKLDEEQVDMVRSAFYG